MPQPRRVDPSLYTTDYYLKACTGHAVFTASHGSTLEPRLLEVIKHAPSWLGKRILDIGCGRGELVFHTVSHGARFAVGIDYSADSIVIAQSAQKKQPQIVQNKTRFFTVDAKQLPFPDQSFDYIFFTEVWEHLYPEEVDRALDEMYRVLTPEGKLIIHTAPTWVFNDLTYRFWCYPVSTIVVWLYKLVTGKGYPTPPAKLRGEYELLMHVNESDHLTVFWQLLKHGFRGTLFSTNQTVDKPILSWKDTFYNSIVYLTPLSQHFPFNLLWGNDIFAVVQKKSYSCMHEQDSASTSHRMS